MSSAGSSTRLAPLARAMPSWVMSLSTWNAPPCLAVFASTIERNRRLLVLSLLNSIRS